MHAAKPSLAAYCPASQLLHSSTADATEYLPTAHSVHALAPVRSPVFVIEPFVHAMHADSADSSEYCPATHFVHLTAPASAPVFVIEPAWQV